MSRKSGRKKCAVCFFTWFRCFFQMETSDVHSHNKCNRCTWWRRLLGPMWQASGILRGSCSSKLYCIFEIFFLMFFACCFSFCIKFLQWRLLKLWIKWNTATFFSFLKFASEDWSVVRFALFFWAPYVFCFRLFVQVLIICFFLNYFKWKTIVSVFEQEEHHRNRTRSLQLQLQNRTWRIYFDKKHRRWRVQGFSLINFL